MGSTHHHRHTGGAEGIGHTVRLGDHAGHRPNPDQVDVVRPHVPHQLFIAHGLSVAVDQQHLVIRRRDRLQQKHPQVRHEVLGHTIVGAIQKDFHRDFTQ